MRCTTTLNEVLSNGGSFFWSSKILVVTCRLIWPTLIEMQPSLATLYITWDFRFLSKDDFRVGKQVLILLVVQMIWISRNFFNLLTRSWVIFFLCIENNPRFRLLIVKAFKFLKSCSFWVVCCDLFFCVYFIQHLINNTGGSLSWILIFNFHFFNLM